MRSEGLRQARVSWRQLYRYAADVAGDADAFVKSHRANWCTTAATSTGEERMMFAGCEVPVPVPPVT